MSSDSLKCKVSLIAMDVQPEPADEQVGFRKVIWFLESTLCNRQLYNVEWLKGFEIPGKFIKIFLLLEEVFLFKSIMAF